MGLSVLMSVYNKEKPENLMNAIESIIDQTYKCDEIILIKDGKLGQELEDVVDYYQSRLSNLIIYQFDENVMLGLALKKGVELCSCDVIARMDTDDIAMENRFEIQYKYLSEHPEVSAVGGFIEEFDENGDLRIKEVPIRHDEIVRYSKMRNPINHMTVMFRKSHVISSGNYKHFPYLEDYYLWCRMMAKGYRFCNIPSVLVKARAGKKMYRRRGGFNCFLAHRKLRIAQYQLKLINYFEYCIAVTGSFIVTMSPDLVREVLYKGFLRKRINFK